MSRQTFIFVSAPAQDADLMHLIEQALGGQFIRAEGSDPYIRVGTVAVYVGGHEFDDDDIAWPQGSDIPLQSEYPAMIEVRDTGGDLQRQREIARKIFAALRSAGRHRAVYIDDMQKSWIAIAQKHKSPKQARVRSTAQLTYSQRLGVMATNARSQQACAFPLHFDLYGCGNLNTILCTLPQPYKKNCAGCHNHTIMAARSRRVMC
jgi:hypothetical protein